MFLSYENIVHAQALPDPKPEPLPDSHLEQI